MKKFMLFVSSLLLAACGQQSGNQGNAVSGQEDSADYNSYVVLDEDLQQLKDEFNASKGRVRLMFLVGPTCGICLRGMADLNDAFIAASQNDDRLETFVVHVPTLGAREEHVADTIPLLSGPKVHHYWEETGIIGSHYTDVMDVDLYVWDFWAIYGPDVTWDEALPPKPDYYEHQLAGMLDRSGGFPRSKMLNAERFATEAKKYIERVDSGRFTKGDDLQLSDSELQGDGTVIPVVAQPRNVAVSQHIRMSGGYRNLKRIQSISKRGRWLINGNEYPLQIEMSRPNRLSRKIEVENQDFISAISSKGEISLSGNAEYGLPVDLETVLLETYEFDGLLVEWPDKGSTVAMNGMLKLGDVLAWKLDLTQDGGQHWHLYIDSHAGTIVKADILGESDTLEFSILQSDVRDVDGFKYPHRIEYRRGDDETLAVEIFDDIRIDQEAFDMADESVTH